MKSSRRTKNLTFSSTTLDPNAAKITARSEKMGVLSVRKWGYRYPSVNTPKGVVLPRAP